MCCAWVSDGSTAQPKRMIIARALAPILQRLASALILPLIVSPLLCQS
jgi:hypothetical protein